MSKKKPFIRFAGRLLWITVAATVIALLSACSQTLPKAPVSGGQQALDAGQKIAEQAESSGKAQGVAANPNTSEDTKAASPLSRKAPAGQTIAQRDTASIEITPKILPDAGKGKEYSQQLTVSGGVSPYTFTVLTIANQGLPVGMMLSATGLLSGIPTEIGTFNFTVQVTDSASATATQAYTLVVVSDDSAPLITYTITGTKGDNDWYVSAVTVTWTVVDSESAITNKVGCDPTTLNAETPLTGTTLTCTATSIGGTSSVSVTIKIDLTPPTVTVTPDRDPDKNGWYNHPVTFTFTGTDALSGIGACDPPVTYSGPDKQDLTVQGGCKDLAGNVGSAELSFDFDSTPPVLAPVVTPNPVYLHGEAIVEANATDATSGVDPATVSCPAVDTSSVGIKTITCTAMDYAGNTGSGSTSYSVIYKFVGFNPPLNEGWNEENAGRTIPVKWSLFDAYDVPVDGVKVIISVSEASCDSGAVTGGTEGPTDITGDLQPQHHGNYHYNWNTSKDYANSCRAVGVDLGEGFNHWILVMFR